MLLIVYVMGFVLFLFWGKITINDQPTPFMNFLLALFWPIGLLVFFGLLLSGNTTITKTKDNE